MTEQIRKWLALVFFFFISLCLVYDAFGQSSTPIAKMDYYTYVHYTGSTIGVAWDPIVNASYYQIRIKSFERNVYTNVVVVPTLTYYFQLNKSGHYIVEARSVNDNNGVLTYSEWAESTNPVYATVGGAQRAWWIYCYVAPPGPPVIQ